MYYIYPMEGSDGVLVRHTADDQKVPSSNPGFANILFIKQFLSNFLG